MAVNLPAVGGLLVVPGVCIGTACASIGKPDVDDSAAGENQRDDVVVISLCAGTTAAGVFTRSAFRAAPVEIASERIAGGGIRGLVINSGNANAATGTPGRLDALAICDSVANSLDVSVDFVAPFSTGVIGERLPVAAIQQAVQVACERLEPDGWEAAARAIMTTDTQPKVVSGRVNIDEEIVTLSGMAKGSGMIKPDMATMLAYVFCDASISNECLSTLTREVADLSFNRITVDGDTSTNDAFVILATGVASHAAIASRESVGYRALRDGIAALATDLAQRIVRDGEGATKFVTVRVCGGTSGGECLQIAYTVAESLLVKTAIFAGDPNWGRFCMAIGRAGIADLDPTRVNLWLDDVRIVEAGLAAEQYDETAATQVMAQDEFEIRIELGRGTHEEVIWTTDLSYDYVRINAEYRS
ncbi:MAG: bifunctional glutamate N-acetyltransferase/amino-acid acetyltransferase ArgJ [Gammaproteobacteria bacterium]|nr:bifunctional glutamate N-acetyltransferase/amino-acid acetyltransferase ArgJ [Gammaproteobacteria bacterium]